MVINRGQKSRILLVDDHPAMSWAIKSMILKHSLLEIVGEAYDGIACLQKIKDCEPDMLVLDINLPQADGLQVIRKVKKTHPHIRFLVMSALDERVYSYRVKSIGAHGFISKTACSELLVSAITAVACGYSFFSLNQYGQPITDQERAISELSSREFQIMEHMAAGKSNIEIASLLKISNKTVATYKVRIYKKLQVNSIKQLIDFINSAKLTDDYPN